MKSLRHFAVLFCCISLLSAVSARAQDIKPVKDKATKKYGYQTKDKNWVIAPSFDNAKKFDEGVAEVEVNGFRGLIDIDGKFVIAPEYDDITKFDKHGFCELKRKVNGTKLHGIANRGGQIVIPVEARSVDVDRSGDFIYAKYDTEVPGFKVDQEWGVFDREGNEIFAPQFYITPSFRDGIGIAKSARNGLYGVIGGDGRVIEPFKYLNISYTSHSYRGLGTDLSHTIWSEDMRSSQSMPQPGAVIPYDPHDDPIRALAWHRGPVGIRLHCNNLKLVQLYSKLGGTQAACMDLPIDWGFGRFVRLEPCKVPAGTPDAMYYGSGNCYYTLKALLYEPDGRFVKEVCSRGWIEANFRDGAIYNADGKERWAVLADPNAIELPAFTVDVLDYQPISHADIFSGLGIPISDVSKLSTLYNYTDLCKDIIEGENIGVTTYLPRVPDVAHARAAKAAGHAHVFYQHFHMGDVVNCKVIKKGEELSLDLSKDLVCRYKDKIEDPHYTFSGGSELIYWGPNNARTVRLGIEVAPKSANATVDDVHHTELSYVYVLDMYEEDGTWLRTLAEAPFVDFVQDGVVVFEPLGIALITRPLHKGPIKIVGEPLPHTLSALEAALLPPAPPAKGQQPGSGNQKPGPGANPGQPAGGQGTPATNNGSSTNTNRNGSEPRPQQQPVRGGGR